VKWDEETWLRLGTNLDEHYQLYVQRTVLSPVAWTVDLQPVSLTLRCQLISTMMLAWNKLRAITKENVALLLLWNLTRPFTIVIAKPDDSLAQPIRKL
jgi:hypothetical protein